MSAAHSSLRQVSPGFCSRLHAGHWTARVRLRQAVRHPLIGLVGSGFCNPSACGNTYQLGCGSVPRKVLIRLRNARIAAQASALSGIIRSPASVFVVARRTVSVCSIRSTSSSEGPLARSLALWWRGPSSLPDALCPIRGGWQQVLEGEVSRRGTKHARCCVVPAAALHPPPPDTTTAPSSRL